MLYAHDFLERHPAGARVYDRHGRELPNVMACDTATGEAILWLPNEGLHIWLDQKLHQIGNHFKLDHFKLQLRERHGFWPAPLTVVLKHPQHP